jgi:hypothetical protein
MAPAGMGVMWYRFLVSHDVNASRSSTRCWMYRPSMEPRNPRPASGGACAIIICAGGGGGVAGLGLAVARLRLSVGRLHGRGGRGVVRHAAVTCRLECAEARGITRQLLPRFFFRRQRSTRQPTITVHRPSSRP